MCSHQELLCAAAAADWTDSVSAVATAGSAIIALGAAIIALSALVGARRTYEKDAAWRRQHETIQFYEALQEKIKELRGQTIDPNGRSSSDDKFDLGRLDSANRRRLSQLLNTYQRLCKGINTGVYDAELFNSNWGRALQDDREVFAAFIEKRRERGSEGAWRSIDSFLRKHRNWSAI